MSIKSALRQIEKLRDNKIMVIVSIMILALTMALTNPIFVVLESYICNEIVYEPETTINEVNLGNICGTASISGTIEENGKTRSFTYTSNERRISTKDIINAENANSNAQITIKKIVFKEYSLIDMIAIYILWIGLSVALTVLIVALIKKKKK